VKKYLRGTICAGVFLFASPVYAVPVQIQIEAVETEFFVTTGAFANTSEFGQTISGFLTVNTGVLPNAFGPTFANYYDNATLTLTTTGSLGELTVTSSLMNISIGVFPDANSFQLLGDTSPGVGVDAIISNTLGLGINSVELGLISGATGAVQNTGLPPILDLNKFLDSSANPNGPITRFNDLSISGLGIDGRYVITKFGDSVLSIPGITIPTPPTNPISAPGVLGLMVLGLVSLFGFVGRRQHRLS